MRDRYHQTDLLEWAANERKAELDRARSQPATPLSPKPGRLYVGRSVTGTEFSGYYRHTTGSGLWALFDGDQLVALVMPQTCREVPE